MSAEDEDPSLALEVVEQLGCGSFGTVFKAYVKETGQIVAIKQIDLETSEDDISEIQQEIAVLSTCASPFVTKYYGSFVKGYKLWIVMEYMGGGSCHDLLKPGPFREGQIAVIMRELLLGLQYLHKEGKIHRDIKAANVLLSDQGKVKLADFGVAAQLTGLKSQRNTFVGTPYWMAPEVIAQTHGYDYKADIWSLGITALELSKGTPPNSEVHPMKVLFLIPKDPPPTPEGDRWSMDFRDFVARCLVKDPSKRYNATDLLKHKFIRNAGPVEVLTELIERKQGWDELQERQGRSTYPKLYEETLRTMSSEPEESWDFDTIRSMDTVRTNPFASRQGTMRHSPGSSTSAFNTALKNLALNSAPSNDNIDTRGRNATYTRNNSFRDYGTTRRRTKNTFAEPDQYADDDLWPERNDELSVVVPTTPYGKMGSTVRLFRRAPDHSNGTNPYGTVFQDERPIQDENRAPVIIPSSQEGRLGRQVHSDIVEPAIQKVHPQTISSTERNALARLDGAWKDLDAINPEIGYHLVRNLLERLQQNPQLQAVLAPPQLFGSPTKPKLSGETLFSNPSSNGNPIRSPKEEILRRKRTQSNASNQSKASSNTSGRRDDDDFFFEEDERNKTQGEKLADVLYGRWLEGLRSRWEPNY
ncbi:kinase-like domain-containing protein [Sphaerosporella brunnea]|uniref:non-specific serine/threonine protein kinase n=1 Tax=Sphaerosporella brunnea TaxID=1250544 RepID=A0A5J5F351_9PEZI|nr:kinase-like domain-containing protein [Sphaerosporella brunnea]